MPSSEWDQYKAPPATGNQWDQYKQPAQPPAPTSGILGSKVPEPAGLMGAPTPEENNKSALFDGLKGMGKSLVDTAQSIHNSNMAVAPQNSPLRQAAPFSSGDKLLPHVDPSTHGDPDQMAGKVFGNIAQMAAPIGEGAKVLPSAERAGAKLSELGTRFKGVPVSLANTAPELKEAASISTAGGGPMGAAGNLMERSQINPSPMDFPEARKYYSNVSELSGDEAKAMKPSMKRQIGNVRQAFHSDLMSAANQAQPATEIGYRGQPMNSGGGEYDNAVSEYRHAKQLQSFGKKAAVGGAGLLGTGIAAQGVRKLVGK
jgi:hypothetical protein